MIYIITSNYFLWIGLKSLLQPVNIKSLCTSACIFSMCNQLNEGDILLFDELQLQTLDESQLKNMMLSCNIIILVEPTRVSNTFSNGLFIPINTDLHTLHSKLTKKIHSKPSDFIETDLTTLQKRIAILALRGYDVKKISFITGVNTKTVYYNRLRVCNSFGVRNIRDLLKYKVLLKCSLTNPL